MPQQTAPPASARTKPIIGGLLPLPTPAPCAAASVPNVVAPSLSTYFLTACTPPMEHSLAGVLPAPAPSSSPMSLASPAFLVAPGFPGPAFALAAGAITSMVKVA